MQGELSDVTLLKLWYTYLLAAPALALAAYLTARATVSMPWRGRVVRAARIVSTLGTLFTLAIVLDRFGIETLALDAHVYGYLSLSGAVTAIVVGGAGTFLSPRSPNSADGDRETSGRGIIAVLAGGIGALLALVRSTRSSEVAEDAPLLDMNGALTGSTMVLSSVRGAAAWLVVRSGRSPGTVMQVVGERVTVGSSPDSEVHIDDPSVGPAHALIRGRNGGYTLADLGSRKGTWVNGKLEAGAILKDGSTISMGSSELFFSKLGGDDSEADGGPQTAGAVLLVRSGPAMGSSFPVVQGDIIIGRRPGEGGAQVDDSSVSQRHTLLRTLARGSLLYDLGSANGTTVGDVDLIGVPLKNGDILKFGDAEVQFVHEESA